MTSPLPSRASLESEPQSTIRLIFTYTIKMGMGVDIQDIERVVIYGAPSSMVDLWQQVGRCARGEGMKGMATECYGWVLITINHI